MFNFIVIIYATFSRRERSVLSAGEKRTNVRMFEHESRIVCYGDALRNTGRHRCERRCLLFSLTTGHDYDRANVTHRE